VAPTRSLSGTGLTIGGYASRPTYDGSTSRVRMEEVRDEEEDTARTDTGD